MRNLTVSLLNINEAQLTINVLDILARLSTEDWAVQLILVDNGSREDQIQQLSDWFSANIDYFSEVLFVAAFRNLGVSGGRNIALKLASCDRILILDNDLVLPDNSRWLDTLWLRMEGDPQISIVGPMLVFDDHPDIVQGAGIGLTDQGRVGYLDRARPVSSVSSTPIEVVGTPAACWLLRREAQRAVGLFSDEFYPMQYEDIDFCVRLGQAGWKILCDRTVRIRHIGNVTTRNVEDHPFARMAVRHGMRFRKKWSDILPQIATITEEDIYWGSVPRARD